MKLLADAHVSRLMLDFLPAEGHDCVHAEELKAGMADEEILSIAAGQGRVLLTADKDFGDLVFRQGLPAVGVILLRLRAISEAERFELFRKHWPTAAASAEAFFVVVSNRQVRRTPLPGI
jgi:predicted nuclease of predicted toxin-antitoxin system